MPMECSCSAALLTPATRPFCSKCARPPVAAAAGAAAEAAPHAAGDSTECSVAASLDCCAALTCSALLPASGPQFACCVSRLAALRMAMAKRSRCGRWKRMPELSLCPVSSATAQRYRGYVNNPTTSHGQGAAAHRNHHNSRPWFCGHVQQMLGNAVDFGWSGNYGVAQGSVMQMLSSDQTLSSVLGACEHTATHIRAICQIALVAEAWNFVKIDSTLLQRVPALQTR